MRKVTLTRVVLLALLLIWALSHLSSFALSRIISRTVKDHQGNSLAGTTGLVKNTELVVFTNAKGILSIDEVNKAMFVNNHKE
jgi:hypothetical protein